MFNEIELRLGSFLVMFALIAIIEIIIPKRKLSVKKSTRWFRNLSIILLDSLAVRLLIPFTTVGVAVYAQTNAIGILHHLAMPPYLHIVFAIIILDLLIYIQHVVFHYVPILWRLHKIHHIDQDYDVTTGLRFHPIEIILSVLIKCLAILAFGVPYQGVIIFEILLNLTAMFNHGNINIPKKLDSFIRLFIVTPDMHRVHHSVIKTETNSNFGFNLSVWDKVFKTYKKSPAKGHNNMTIGLKEYQNPAKTNLLEMLLIPFYNKDKNE